MTDAQPYPYTDIKDTYVLASTIIDAEHRQIHKGNHYFAGDYATTVTTRNYLIIAPSSKTCHLLLDIATDGKAQVSIYEDTTVSGNGTPISTYNNNRISTNTAQTTIFHTPTITGDGSLLTTFLVGAASNSGSQVRSVNELIINSSKKYLLRVTGSSLIVSFNPTFYEI